MRNEAVRHLDENDALVADRLDSFGKHTDGNLGFAGNNFDIHEQARTPGHLRIGQGDPCFGRARILPKQCPHVRDTAFGFRVEGSCLNNNLFTHPNDVQILGGNDNLGPYGRQVGNRKYTGIFFDCLTERDVFLNNHAIERCADFVAIETTRNRSARSECNQLLLTVGNGDFSLP